MCKHGLDARFENLDVYTYGCICMGPGAFTWVLVRAENGGVIGPGWCGILV